MFFQILRHTPYWVWLVLAMLLWRGALLMRPRQVPRSRVAILPALFVLLSAAGVVAGFGLQPQALICWGAGLVLAAFETHRAGPPRGAQYLAERRSYQMPGSGVPLLLIVLAFSAKYSVGIELALHPALRNAPMFAAAVCAAYGAISGVFLGRALRLRALHGPIPVAAEGSAMR